VKGPRRQSQLTHGRFHQSLAGFIQGAAHPSLPLTHIRIADDVRALKTLSCFNIRNGFS
jgi:hypothetical protein